MNDELKGYRLYEINYDGFDKVHILSKKLDYDDIKAITKNYISLDERGIIYTYDYNSNEFKNDILSLDKDALIYDPDIAKQIDVLSVMRD